jgi:signal transduction histidine kinase
MIVVDSDELPDGLVVADAAGTVIEINQPAARLLGLDRAGAVGRPYTEVLPFRDAAGRDWWSCLRPYDGLSIRTGAPERLLNAGAKPVLVAARYIRKGPAGPVERLVVTLRDATVRQRLERGGAELVSVVSHELRSPLTSVKGFTATLLAKWERFTDEQKKVMLATVNADADRVTRLLGELLDVSRIDAGRLEIHRTVVDLPAIARRVIDGQVAAGEPEDRFRLTCEPLPELWGDPDKLTQVVANLVENGVRHGAGVVRVKIESAGGGVRLEVTDEGEGVAPEVLPHLFMKFWKGGRRGGTGLGLFVARGLVEAHGGTIAAGSTEAGGARFTVHLPLGTPEFA